MELVSKALKYLVLSTKVICIICIILNPCLVSCKKPSNQKDDSSSRLINAPSNSSKLIGTYSVVSAIEYKNVQGKRDSVENFYGPDPKGRLILDENGNYMLTVMVNNLPKETAEDGKTLVGKGNGSAKQHTQVVKGSIANFGTYKDSSGFLVLNIEKATYPNWDGLRQPRRYHFSGDILIYVVPNASSGGGRVAEFNWKRIN